MLLIERLYYVVIVDSCINKYITFTVTTSYFVCYPSKTRGDRVGIKAHIVCHKRHRNGKNASKSPQGLLYLDTRIWLVVIYRLTYFSGEL